MKGQMLSSAALSEWMFIYFAERQEGHPKEGLGWQCKRGQKILTSGYRAHGPAKAEQFCIVVYFSLRWPRNPHFQMGFLPSSRRWHNLLSLQLLWGGCACPHCPPARGDVLSSHLTPKPREEGRPHLPCPNLQGRAWPCWGGRGVNREKRWITRVSWALDCWGLWLFVLLR